jgi:acetyl-CoA carboxylase biotin carboxyl carrier protein
MDITAHMAGSILAIKVHPGDQVRAGDEVVILESMKMEMPITTLIDGTVTQVRVQSGDVVQEDDVLVVVDGTP